MRIRYIKLGIRGVWEEECIERDNTIRLGYESPYHQESLQGKWEVVRDYWLKVRNGDEGAASRDINQIRDFYELTESDIWVTFFRRKLYWCRTSKDVIELDDGSRIRRVIGTWSCKDANGRTLAVENIDGRITKVQGFRGTICGVALPDYLLRKINGEPQPDVEAAKRALGELKANIEELIRGLWWKDFELLVDLIFAKAGWQRISVLGKTEKDIDLDVYSPLSRKRAFVQVKSSTNAEQIAEYRKVYSEHEQYNEMYFISHTFAGDPKEVADDDRIHLWGVPQIAELVIHEGLVDWLITKRS